MMSKLIYLLMDWETFLFIACITTGQRSNQEIPNIYDRNFRENS